MANSRAPGLDSTQKSEDVPAIHRFSALRETSDVWEGRYLSGDVPPDPHTIDILELMMVEEERGIRNLYLC